MWNYGCQFGYHRSTEIAGYPGYLDGGIRISIDGDILTRYTDRSDPAARYSLSGERLPNPEEFVGEDIDFGLLHLKEITHRFLRNDLDRHEILVAKMTGEPGIGFVTLSFCDGEHARIAFQPRRAEYGRHFPTDVTVGHVVDPNELGQEIIECYEDCVRFAEIAYGEYDDMIEELAEVRDWAAKHIQQLKDAIDSA